jgi:hypothetical protein
MKLVGLCAALRILAGRADLIAIARDHQAYYKRDRRRVDTMREYLRDVPGLRLGYEEAFFGPGLVLMWDEATTALTQARIRETDARERLAWRARA